jgi:hypothetical protein
MEVKPMEDSRYVRNRLLFAKLRLDQLSQIAGGDFGAVSETERQQPLQEFFFHLVGAIEFLAQTVNDSRKLIAGEEDVTPQEVSRKLPNSDPIKGLLRQLYPPTRRRQLHQDPYSEDGSHFRIIAFRNRVCHHGRNPFYFRVGSNPPCSLFLDPRNRSMGSDKPAMDELILFWTLVNDKCEKVLSAP